ncbi:MAG: hypothetical protein FJ146_10780 [Deltaproteobacteria bacterium]|nr:hypothetical protein [Deltaproteobacteria bacterium]
MRLSSRSFYLILGLFFLFQLMTQPFFVFAGDPVAIRHEARYLLKHHTLGVPFADKEEIPANLLPPQSQPDQYFWENQERQAYFSRWGLTNTLSFLAPMAVVGPDAQPLRLILALNTWNALLATLFLAALLVIARKSQAALWGVVCIFAYLFATAISFYLRAQSSELLQMVQLAGILCLFRYLDHYLAHPETLGKSARPMQLMILISVLLTTLVHTKVYYCLFFGFVLLALFWRRLDARESRRLAYCGVFFMTLCGILQLALNYYKFGSVLQMGLGPAFPRVRSDWYDLAHFKNSLPDYFIGPTGSVFIYFPVVVFALLGAKIHAKIYPRESWLIWLNLLVIVIVAGGWKNSRGDWGFGPRYLVPAISLTLIPALFAYRQVAARGMRDTRRALFTLIFGALMLWGTKRQIVVAQLDFFAAQQVSGSLREINDQLYADQYFQKATQYKVTEELLTFCRGGNSGRFYILDRTIRTLYPDLGEKLTQLWQDECTYNVYFLALDRSRWFS